MSTVDTTAHSASARAAHPIRILVVEDEQIIAINLREILENLGYVVPAMAASGEQALQTAIEHRPDLVLMDIRLKGELDGIETAERLWNTLQIPVIYVTGHSDHSTLERAKFTAPFGYILKPVKEKELYVVIETALQRYEREQLLSAVFQGIGEGVIVADPQGQVKLLNQTAEHCTGWPLAEAKEQALSQVLNVADGKTQQPVMEQLLTTALAQERAIALPEQLVLTSKQGHTIPIAPSLTPIKNSKGEAAGVVVVFRDLTQQYLAAERNQAVERAQYLEEQMTEMQRLNQLKEDFLSTVSHELRAPLSNIQLATRMLSILLDQFDLLTQESSSNSAAFNRYIRILQEQSEQELSLVNNLLDIQRLNAEAYPLDLAIVQLETWLPHILEPLIEEAATHQQQIQITLPAALPSLQTDPHILARIVSELVHNACKYTPAEGKITITARVPSPDSSDQLPYLLLEVCNSGIEISSEDQTRIFEPFYRVSQTGRSVRQGTGLGLSLVKKFVRHLGGAVRVNSAAGTTCFTLVLPLWPCFDEQVDLVPPTAANNPS